MLASPWIRPKGRTKSRRSYALFLGERIGVRHPERLRLLQPMQTLQQVRQLIQPGVIDFVLKIHPVSDDPTTDYDRLFHIAQDPRGREGLRLRPASGPDGPPHLLQSASVPRDADDVRSRRQPVYGVGAEPRQLRAHGVETDRDARLPEDCTPHSPQ